MFRNYKKNAFAEHSYDIYAFGSLLWVLCEGTGQARPQVYSHCHDIDTMEKAVCDDGIRPGKPPDTPEAWWNLMTLCWREDRSTTMQNVQEPLLQMYFQNACTVTGSTGTGSTASPKQ